ncbi:hypothetical protein GALL_541920 [mine drainage metagenome]|uniref:Uncharacterized protein n=1 Tax=mine drainage metagenome TaxID=410659 RepID=A0A1J5NZQ2_9ZZZZ
MGPKQANIDPADISAILDFGLHHTAKPEI